MYSLGPRLSFRVISSGVTEFYVGSVPGLLTDRLSYKLSQKYGVEVHLEECGSAVIATLRL